ncbi:MAG: 50S ribosomal protein L11 methyltransferase [Myxococcota bacterium]
MSAVPPAWMALSVRMDVSVDAMGLDVTSGELFELGAEGIEQRDGPPIELVASFDTSDAESLVDRVKRRLLEIGVPLADVRIERWPEVDWATYWRRHFQPLSFGRVWIIPTWLDAPAHAETVLRIDPGMAFGTGYHATTALCLHRIVELSPIERLLDVGTGTGILAMGAAALGAKVRATDNDPVAVEQARDNIEANRLSDRITVVEDGELDDSHAYDVVVANILAAPLIRLAPKITARVAPRGRLLLSGLLHNQAAEIEQVYSQVGYEVVNTSRRDEWICLELCAIGSVTK